MRLLPTLLLALCLFACGKPETPDAGTDAGPLDAGTLNPPVCLPDSFDAGPPSDAGNDFSCRGRAPGTGGQAELVITGKATQAGFTRTPLVGVTIDLLGTDGTVLASTLTGDGGLYRLTWDAGCLPLDGEVRATHPPSDAGFALAYASPPSPWRYDRSNLELVLFDESTSRLAAALANVTLVDGGAVLAMTVDDCKADPVEGALVSTTGGVGAIRYVGAAGLPTATQMSTSASGELVIFNLPGESVEVTATLDGGVISQRVVRVHPDSATGTSLEP